VKTAFQEIILQNHITLSHPHVESLSPEHPLPFSETHEQEMYDVQGNKSPLLKNDEDSAERPRASLVCPISQPSFVTLE